ncbi:hypothetical protein A9K66_26790 [Mesorhizobium sp. AA23]|nr:hypothetical protein A9K66_26790 [Mesorhizobium sp. AA23]
MVTVCKTRGSNKLARAAADDRECRLDMGKIGGALRRQRHAACQPREQSRLETLFQKADVLADGGLREPELGGRGGEIRQARSRFETA